MGSMKQKCIDAIRAGGGLGFPIMDEDDYKGRLDRIEAALEAQYGWVMKEKESKSKKKKKDGKVSIWLSAALALVSGSFLCATYAAERVVVNYFAGEGDDAVIQLEADQGDDAADEALLKMGADGTAHIAVGGTEVVDVTSSGFRYIAVSTIAETSNSRTCTSADYGKTIFVSHGGAVAITLPANGAAAGSWIDFIVTGSDSTAPTISTATVDTLITVNDAAADSVTYGSGHRIGAAVRIISNGTKWIAINLGSTTMTVATD